MAEQDGKFGIGKVLKQARQPDDQRTGKPGSQTTKQPDNKETIKPDDQISSHSEEERVNLCVKVPKSWRKHWAIQAKTQDVTMTDVMIEALTARFGLPDNQTTR